MLWLIDELNISSFAVLKVTAIHHVNKSIDPVEKFDHGLKVCDLVYWIIFTVISDHSDCCLRCNLNSKEDSHL